MPRTRRTSRRTRRGKFMRLVRLISRVVRPRSLSTATGVSPNTSVIVLSGRTPYKLLSSNIYDYNWKYLLQSERALVVNDNNIQLEPCRAIGVGARIGVNVSTLICQSPIFAHFGSNILDQSHQTNYTHFRISKVIVEFLPTQRLIEQSGRLAISFDPCLGSSNRNVNVVDTESGFFPNIDSVETISRLKLASVSNMRPAKIVYVPKQDHGRNYYFNQPGMIYGYISVCMDSIVGTYNQELIESHLRITTHFDVEGYSDQASPLFDRVRDCYQTISGIPHDPFFRARLDAVIYDRIENRNWILVDGDYLFHQNGVIAASGVVALVRAVGDCVVRVKQKG